MLNENNLSFLGDFTTGIDYVLTDDGDLAYQYHVDLADVQLEIAAWELPVSLPTFTD